MKGAIRAALLSTVLCSSSAFAGSEWFIDRSVDKMTDVESGLAVLGASDSNIEIFLNCSQHEPMVAVDPRFKFFQEWVTVEYRYGSEPHQTLEAYGGSNTYLIFVGEKATKLISELTSHREIYLRAIVGSNVVEGTFDLSGFPTAYDKIKDLCS